MNEFDKEINDDEKTEEKYIEELENYRKLDETNPNRYSIACTLYELANLQNETNRYKEAEANYTEALEIYRKLANNDFDVFISEIINVIENLTKVKEKLSKYDDIKNLKKIFTEIYPEEFLSNLAQFISDKASGHFKIWLYLDAEDGFYEALQIYRKLAEINPDTYLPYLAATLDNLAEVQYETDQDNEAEANYAEAVEIWRKLAQTNPDAYLQDLAETLDNLANIQRNFTKSKANHAEAEEIRRKLAEMNL